MTKVSTKAYPPAGQQRRTAAIGNRCETRPDKKRVANQETLDIPIPSTDGSLAKKKKKLVVVGLQINLPPFLGSHSFVSAAAGAFVGLQRVFATPPRRRKYLSYLPYMSVAFCLRSPQGCYGSTLFRPFLCRVLTFFAAFEALSD
ncbi:unnamed protein product [Sphagnum jensenii]|uniref:Uncharacterized protein n=1 Tax=Sphagnum jensenii TaxID=128206 RepID=A0ABP0WGM1_9BRYO